MPFPSRGAWGPCSTALLPLTCGRTVVYSSEGFEAAQRLRQQQAWAVPALSLYQISSRCITAGPKLAEGWCGVMSALSALLLLRQCRPA
jgi:hypothetical protein